LLLTAAGQSAVGGGASQAVVLFPATVDEYRSSHWILLTWHNGVDLDPPRVTGEMILILLLANHDCRRRELKMLKINGV
jgi:hypothetical protein